MTDILDELQWRGLLAQHTDLEALREHLNAGPVTFYCGYDPTAPSLHHGHLVQLIVMRHLQLAGHRPLALVGGATGQIGDPRQSGERQLQSTEVVKGWADRLRSQISRFLDFEGPAAATMVNNLDWTQEMSAIDLLRTIGKYFRVGTMLNKDIVARRIASDEGISYTEFSYQVLQANDFLELYRRHGCTLETGGNDQWGNMVGGVDLIRKVEGVDTHVMTTPIITKADGTKFGKSEGGAIWLDPEMMTPYAFYQFWLQVADDDVVRFLKIFTFKSREEIEALAVEVAERPHQRAAQKALAASVTELVHGADQLQRVLAATDDRPGALLDRRRAAREGGAEPGPGRGGEGVQGPRSCGRFKGHASSMAGAVDTNRGRDSSGRSGVTVGRQCDTFTILTITAGTTGTGPRQYECANEGDPSGRESGNRLRPGPSPTDPAETGRARDREVEARSRWNA